jgi:O-antigen ligase/tetratricopeptide (TPR) repeat protein
MKKENKSRIESVVRYLLVAACLAPFIAWPGATLDYTLSRTLIFCVLVEAAFLGYCVLLLKNREYAPRGSWVLWTYGAFFVLQAIAYYGSFDPGRSFWGTMSRSMDGGFFVQVHAAAFLFLLIAVFRSAARWQILFRMLLWASVAAALAGIYQFFDPPVVQSADILLGPGTGRIQGPFANPITFATYLAIAFFILADSFAGRFATFMAGGVSGPFADKRWVWLGTGLIFAIAMIGSLSRGPRVGFAAGVLFVTAFGIYRRMPTVRAIGLAMSGSVVLVIIGFALISPVTKFNPLDRFLPLVQFGSQKGDAGGLAGDASVSNRVLTWNSSLQAIRERPFGWGQEGFRYAFDRFYDPRLLTSRTAETWWDRAHDLYLDIAVPLGIPALIAYLFFVGSIFFTALFAHPLLAAGVIAYAVSGITFFDTLPTAVLFLTLAAYVVSLWEEAGAPSGKNMVREKFLHLYHSLKSIFVRDPSPWRSIGAASGILVSAAVLLYVVSTSVSIMRANYFMNMTGSLKYADALGSFERALSYSAPEAIRNEIEYERSLYIARAADSGLVTGDRIRSDLLHAEHSLALVRQAHPHDAKILWLSAHIANLSAGLTDGQDRKDFAQSALAFAHAALEASPRRQQLLYEKAQALFIGDNYESAIGVLREIVDLSPHFPGSHFSLGVGLIGAGQTEAGIVEIEWARSLGYPFEQTDAKNWLAIAAIYYEQKNFDRMVEIYSGLAVTDPENAYYHRLLAGTYLEAGRLVDAKIAAERMCEIDATTCDAAAGFLGGLRRQGLDQ